MFQPTRGLLKCPYYDKSYGICLASFSGMPIDQAKVSRFCDSEDHDLCAIFLSKILRQSGSVYTGKQIREFTLK
jgi:hypothetical protein